MRAGKIFQRIFYLFSLGLAGGLLLAFLGSFISPETFWMLAFMGLLFPVMFMANALGLIVWLIVYPRRALIHLLPLLVCLNQFLGIFNFKNGFSATPDEENRITLLSYNVRLFDLYNWTENKKTRDSIIHYVHSARADIICFQEFFHEDSGKFNTLDTLRQILDAKKVHIEYSAHVKKINHWGIATFSSYPIAGKGRLEFPDETDNISIYTDLVVHSDTVRVYNLHLESVRFRSEDYKALESLTGKPDNTNLGGPQRILSRLRKAYIRRARQTDIIADHIKKCPYPVLVCGDFNDTPASYTYREIRNNLSDAFESGESGFGATYTGLIPFLRIDYILYDNNTFICDSLVRSDKSFSDHFPLKAVIRMNSKKTD